MIKESWKPIVGYEGLYEVSNLGRVRSLDRYVKHLNTTRFIKGRVLKFGYTLDGYKRIAVSKDGVSKNYRVHRLVALAFIPNPNNLPEVNHKDEDKTNNCVDNLEWCNGKYNSNYGTRCERISRAKSKSVRQYSLHGIFIKEWKSVTAASEGTGIWRQNINNVISGKFKQTGGYIWKRH